ncbi:MAG: hypothetical protein P1U36_07190 [Legionellaceae bacterium]|nr:hypothetical protein [Legionellaceae bacterium]
MLLFNLFLRLHSQAPMPLITEAELEQLSSQMLTQEDLAFAYKKITAAYREAPAQREAYDAFLTHCQNTLGTQSRAAILPLVIDYLAELKASPKETNTHIQIILTLFNIHLHEQTNALGILALGRCYIDQPKAFAAFIQWLMQRHVSSDEILQAHLLQDYFRYHLYSLSTSNNPIERLYALLNSHENTRTLVKKAIQTRCPEEGLASYALDGTVHDPAIRKLDNPALKRPKIEFTPTEHHVKSLHRVFGIPFLMNALQAAYEDKYHALPVPVLLALFNGAHITHQDFSLLLQHLREHEYLKKTLAGLLLDTTLDELIEARINGIPSLILYSEYLTQKISREDDFSTYIHDIKQASTSHLDLIADLSALLHRFEKRNKSHALLAFTHLFEHVLEHPEVLDDDILLRQLRKYKPAKAQLIAHSIWLENNFNSFIHAHTNTSIEAFDYISIEDMWRAVHIKLSTLQVIEDIPNIFPQDKYQLQCRLLKAYLPQLDQDYTLDDFIERLDIEPRFHEHDVTPYERLLIEILVSIDDANLRSNIINRLDTNIPQERPWHNVHINDNSLYMQAAHHGNISLIMWLREQYVKQPESSEHMTHEAAYLGHWPLVHYLHQTSNIHQPLVDKLLKLAVEQNAYNAILPLWNGTKSPRLGVVEKCFNLAVDEGRINCVKALLACPLPPCDAVIAKGYRKAIKTHQTNIIYTLMETATSGHHPCLNKAIKQEKNIKKLPRIKGTKSCSSFIHPCSPTSEHEALAQHGLFKYKIDASRSCSNLVLPPVSSR